METCNNNIDEDCDGTPDNGCSTLIVLSLAPATATRGSNYKGTIAGNGFVSGSTVEITFTGLPTPSFADVTTLSGSVTYVSGKELTLEFKPVPTSFVQGAYQIRVKNPDGSLSNVYSFLQVKNQTGGLTPSITSFSPNIATVGKAFSGTFIGKNFASGAVVEVKAPVLGQFVPLNLLGSTVNIKFVSSTQIDLSLGTVPGTFTGISLKGTHDTRITNPNGQSSNTVKLIIQ